MLIWLKEAAEKSKTNDLLAPTFLAELRRRKRHRPLRRRFGK